MFDCGTGTAQVHRVIVVHMFASGCKQVIDHVTCKWTQPNALHASFCWLQTTIRRIAPACNNSGITAGAAKKAGEAWTAGTSSKSAAQLQQRKKVMAQKLSATKAGGVRKCSGVKRSNNVSHSSGLKKSSSAVATGKAAVAKVCRVSEAAKHVAASAVHSVQKVRDCT